MRSDAKSLDSEGPGNWRGNRNAWCLAVFYHYPISIMDRYGHGRFRAFQRSLPETRWVHAECDSDDDDGSSNKSNGDK